MGVLGPQETSYSDQGFEIENDIIHPLQPHWGYRKAETISYRQEDGSVSEYFHSTLYAMLAIYVELDSKRRGSFLPVLQLAKKTSYKSMVQERLFD